MIELRALTALCNQGAGKCHNGYRAGLQSLNILAASGPGRDMKGEKRTSVRFQDVRRNTPLPGQPINLGTQTSMEGVVHSSLMLLMRHLPMSNNNSHDILFFVNYRGNKKNKNKINLRET